jgi:hypothetical protein
LAIAGAYASGGLVPLFPYMLLTRLHSAFLLSVGVTLLALMANRRLILRALLESGESLEVLMVPAARLGIKRTTLNSRN